MANVIPMSGSGSRFADAGYVLPKPLITVSGQPMIHRVIDAMPPAAKWIFVVRQEHIEKYAIDKVIKARLPEAIIVPEAKPQGQATSCMLALPHIADGEDMFISACDNSFLYDRAKFAALQADRSYDAIYWTFTKNRLLSEKPEAWGWVKLEEDGRTVADMSVKVPVSATPENDHAVVATFWFRRAADFRRAYELMTAANYRINGEFYVDSMPIFLTQMAKRTAIFDVDLYVGWGKPADLHDYEAKEYRFRHNLPVEDKDWDLWKKYFGSL